MNFKKLLMSFRNSSNELLKAFSDELFKDNNLWKAITFQKLFKNESFLKALKKTFISLI